MSSSCPVCDDYDVEVEISGPAQLRRIVGKLERAVLERKLLPDESRSRREIPDQEPFVDLDLSKTMPDMIRYHFRCSACERTFLLQCESYHGSGGKWGRA